MKKLSLKFLIDTPVLLDGNGFFEFYSKSFVPAIVNIFRSDQGVKTIGLYGGWGTGKSTLVEQLKGDKEFWIPVFDVWKYQGDSLRRAFLLYFESYLKTKKVKIPKEIRKEMGGLYEGSEVAKTSKDIDDIPRVNTSKFQRIIAFLRQRWQIPSLVLLAIVWMLARILLPSTNPALTFLRELPGYLMLYAPVWWIFSKLAEKAMDKFTSNLLENTSELTKTQTIIQRREALNSPEQFESLFSKLISLVPKEQRILVVFDNMDRVDGKVAVNVLTTIKTFLEPIERMNIAFLIPCDQDSVRNQVKNIYIDVDPDEYLRKLFGITIWMPEFIQTDLEVYTRDLLREADSGTELIEKEEVVDVIIQAFGRNPRQIKQFINNLVSTLYLAENCEVWEEIIENVEYLAKVLVIKQLYPKGYNKLKIQWFEPERIYNATDEDASLRDFLVSTDKITCNNAKPFIYFKRSNQYSSVKHPDELQQALVQGKVDDVRRIVEENSNIEDVGRFIIGLYPDFLLLNRELLNIVNTHLYAISDLKRKMSQSTYYIKTLSLIDKYLWRQYLNLSTAHIFAQLINIGGNMALRYRKSLVSRYVGVLSNDELAKTENVSFAIDLVKNLLALPTSLLTDENKSKMREGIERNFKTNIDVFRLIESEKETQDYVSKAALVGFVGSIDLVNFQEMLVILPRYKDRIVADELQTVLFDSVIGLMTSISTNNEYSPDKALFFASLVGYSNDLRDISSSMGTNEKLTVLMTQMWTFANQLQQPDNRKDILLIMLTMFDVVEDANRQQIGTALTYYLRQASVPAVQSFLDIFWHNIATKELLDSLSDEYLAVFRERTECRDIMYEPANKDFQYILLSELVLHTAERGTDFIPSLSTIPNRVELMSLLLSELSKLLPQDAKGGYDLVLKNMRSTDPASVKDLLEERIINMFNQTSAEHLSLAANLFIKSDFLGSNRRIGIVKGLLDMVESLSFVLTIDHMPILRSIATVIMEGALSGDLRNKFIKYLFSKVRVGIDNHLLQALLDLLGELNPGYHQFRDDFESLLVRVNTWSDQPSRELVVDGVLAINPSKDKIKLRGYWARLEEARKSGDS
ncbi:hypothetical protein KBD75_00205 [Candidatus Woesebacteria bacterium]|nr:hypothetical protein [Candidatus Woesebacteria bacterium]